MHSARKPDAYWMLKRMPCGFPAPDVFQWQLLCVVEIVLAGLVWYGWRLAVQRVDRVFARSCGARRCLVTASPFAV